jgi:small subunit ribosomal protein S9
MTDQQIPDIDAITTPLAPPKPRIGKPAVVEAPKTIHPVPSTQPKSGYWWGTGRRKTSTARARIKPGTGKFLINDRKVEEFFTEIEHQNFAHLPLKVTNATETYDVMISVQGGGYTGQAGAIALAISRALKAHDANTEPALRDHDLLTTDSRQVERKKYGRAGARRRFQFSKR